MKHKLATKEVVEYLKENKDAHIIIFQYNEYAALSSGRTPGDFLVLGRLYDKGVCQHYVRMDSILSMLKKEILIIKDKKPHKEEIDCLALIINPGVI